MNYTVLSRKWRPKTFEEVVGQSHITTILQNSISQNKVSHAYLFSGPRGVGKTTVARIMSCRLNNIDSIENSIDIMELDGASNRGIDEIREIKESTRYAPTEGKFKIFIIDESHMLTKEAFNALLKTLEEPPSHVLFILATTEYHKLPLTIISRCQRYAFKRISINTMVSYLSKILKEEGFEADDKALYSIAQKSDGSLRDALSLLDKVITLCDTNIVSSEITKNALGIVDEEEYLKILRNITDANLEKCLESINDILNNGVPIINFMDGFNAYLKDAIYCYANYKKNITINQASIDFFKKTNLNIRIVSKLLNVNLEYLIKYNKNLTNISLENHFIKIFSYLNKNNEQNPLDIEKNSSKIDSKEKSFDEKKIDQNKLKAPTIDSKSIYMNILKNIEKDNYKLYCVLMKCDIEVSANSIKIKGNSLSRYEENSIQMEMDKINKIANQDYQEDIKITFSNSQAIQNQKKSSNDNSKDNLNDNEEDIKNEEDHPLFDSVVENLDGKLLK